jgi:hypothetical protein
MPKTPDRNDTCHCGSGKKYKNCHMGKEVKKSMPVMGIVGIAVVVILGIWLLSTAVSGGDTRVDCPPGTVWSEAHQHCH